MLLHRALVTSVTPRPMALVVALAGALAWQRGNGRIRTVGSNAAAVPRVAGPSLQPAISGPRLTSQQLGHALGQRATLVQFSSAFCAPCRATRRILTDMAAMIEGVVYVEVDAESRLDLVRDLSVLRTPTVLVADADGLIVKRSSGQPRKPDVIAAIGRAAASGTADVAADSSHILGRE